MIPAIAAADEEDVSVTVNAPEYITDTFEVTIDISEITDLGGGQFDLTYDPNVIELQSVEPGDIDDIEIPIDGQRLFSDSDTDRVRVVFNVPGGEEVCGSGYMAKIIFDVVGKTGDTTDIIISDEHNRKLSQSSSPDLIPANWTGDIVTIGTLISSSITDTPAVTVTSTSEPMAGSGGITTTDPGPSATDPGPSATNSGPSANGDQHNEPIAAVPVETIRSNDHKSDIQELLRSDNFIAIYFFIGLLAFFYTLTLIEVK